MCYDSAINGDFIAMIVREYVLRKTHSEYYYLEDKDKFKTWLLVVNYFDSTVIAKEQI